MAASDDDLADHEAGGLGLGFFIAKTLLERTGARLSMANREAPANGAVVRVTWPRARFDAEPSEAESDEARTAWRAEVEPL